MLWKPYSLRDSAVWARVDEAGALVADAAGRVDVIYKLAPGAKVYRAAKQNLAEREGAPVTLELSVAEAEPSAGAGAGPASSGARRQPSKGARGGAAPAPGHAPDDAIHVWTDGGASPNPGPSAIGVVIIDGKRQLELSEFLGEGTNQIAELTAMLRGLEEVADRARTVVVYSDSAYAIGLMSQGWKAKANVELVGALRALGKQFRDLRFVKVLGHSGIPLNERTDQLATAALAHRERRRMQVS